MIDGGWKMKKVFLMTLVSAAILLVSCTKSGSLTGTAGSGSGSFSGNLTGSVNGGLSPVSGATVTLYALMPGKTAAALASATTTSTGAFSITYTNPGSSLLFVMSSGGSAGSNGANSNTVLMGIVGNASNAPVSLPINEMTTASTFDLLLQYGLATDNNGTVSFSFPGGASSLGNVTATYTNFITNGGANASLSASNQTILYTVANALASCIENSGNCSNLLKTAANTSGGPAANLLESMVNMNLVSTNATPIYNIAFPLGPTTGYGITGSAPSALTAQPTINQMSFPVGTDPSDLAVDGSGNIWVLNQSSNNVSEISPTGTLLGTFSAGSSPLTEAIDASGNVWIANGSGNTVTELSPTGNIVQTVSVTGEIIGTAIDQFGNIWVGAAFNPTAYKINASGTLVGTFTIPSDPRKFAFDTTGNAWIATASSNVVTELSQSGVKLATFSTGNGPIWVMFDPSGNLWVSNQSSNTIAKLSSQGTVLGTFTASTSPVSGAIDAAGNVWLSCLGNVRKYNSSGVALAAYSNGTSGTGHDAGLVVDPSGNVWAGAGNLNTLIEIPGAAVGPEFFPYTGPIFP